MNDQNRERRNSARGQGLVEYALVLVLVALVVALVLAATGTSLTDVYNSVLTALGLQPGCRTVTGTGQGDWIALQDKFWRGGIKQDGSLLSVCPLCGGLLSGYSGDDYLVDLAGVQVANSGSTWYGYGVTFRSDYTKSGLEGYMFEIEQTNKNQTPVMYFSKWVKGNQVKPPLAVSNLPAGFSWNNPPDMQVSVEGDTFVAYLDGVPVLMAQDSTFKTGGAGVMANAGSTLKFSGLGLSTPECQEAQP